MDVITGIGGYNFPILLQFWEESERGWGFRLDGASLHIDKESHTEYINRAYKDRNMNDIPYEYDIAIGECVEVYVTDELFEEILFQESVRIPQYQLNNLIKLKNIIINDIFFD